MTVYIDDPFPEGFGRWAGGCHLFADTHEELHAFAARLGLKRSWFQDRPARPLWSHYDLTASKRRKALELGAVVEDHRTFVDRVRSALPASSDGTKHGD